MLLIAASLPAEAQYGQRADINRIPSHFYTQVWSGKAYAASQKDTSGVYNIGGANLADLYIVYDDSTNVLTRIEGRNGPSGTWAFLVGDTLDHTGGTVTTSTAVTAGYFPFWNSTNGSGLNGTSTIFQSGTNVGIGTSTPLSKLAVFAANPFPNTSVVASGLSLGNIVAVTTDNQAADVGHRRRRSSMDQQRGHCRRSRADTTAAPS